MKIQKTQKKPSDKHYRSLAKSLSWRICATITTMVISYFVTGSIAVALSIGSIEVFAKLILFYLHERAWNGVNFGRVKHHSEQQPAESN
ncbi:MAG: DUF2061 domain-containing protein [Coxiellaceae bacterium]|nr:DUF2061 domain-containing protein [Coxiellaceae bacterium]